MIDAGFLDRSARYSDDEEYIRKVRVMKEKPIPIGRKPVSKPTSKNSEEKEKTVVKMTAAEKALRTATWARTMTSVIISQNYKKPPFWHVINFLGAGKQESGGIVDLLAIRKDHSKTGTLPKGDGFEIILVQVKGGRALNPSAMDVQRMRAVMKQYGAKSVVLSSWKKGAMPIFRVLSGEVWGEPVDP